MATQLSDTARTILAAAAGRPDRHLLPLPATLKAPPVIVRKTISKLIRTGLVGEVPAGPGEPRWDHTEVSAPLALIITAAGLAAAGLEANEAGTQQAVEQRQTSSPGGSAGANGDAETGTPPAAAKRQATRRRGRRSRLTGGVRTQPAQKPAPAEPRATKQATVVAMLRRAEGASVAELAEATNWQLHSVRGVLTAVIKGRLGLPLISEKGADGTRRYHIAALRRNEGQD